MFELSDYIVGIYKVKDCTDSVTIKNVPPPLPFQMQTQALTQMIDKNSLFDKLKEIVSDSQEIALTPVEEDSENAPPLLNCETLFVANAQGRDTTFEPNCESTALSHMLQKDLGNDSGRDTVCSKAKSSINDSFFKKPLPPSQKANT